MYNAFSWSRSAFIVFVWYIMFHRYQMGQTLEPNRATPYYYTYLIRYRLVFVHIIRVCAYYELIDYIILFRFRSTLLLWSKLLFCAGYQKRTPETPVYIYAQLINYNVIHISIVGRRCSRWVTESLVNYYKINHNARVTATIYEDCTKTGTQSCWILRVSFILDNGVPN